jgi:hypothetical protein
MQADELSQPFTARFAKFLRGKNDLQTLKNVWAFVKENITYRRDQPGDEVVKSPGALWETKVGDCKSFSVMIGSILNNLGYNYKYRVAFYNPLQPNQGHIYPVVVLDDGTEIIVDAVHEKFNKQAKYWKATDYFPGGKKSALSGIGQGDVKNWHLATIAAIFAAIYFAK